MDVELEPLKYRQGQEGETARLLSSTSLASSASAFSVLSDTSATSMGQGPPPATTVSSEAPFFFSARGAGAYLGETAEGPSADQGSFYSETAERSARRGPSRNTSHYSSSLSIGSYAGTLHPSAVSLQSASFQSASFHRSQGSDETGSRTEPRAGVKFARIDSGEELRSTGLERFRAAAVQVIQQRREEEAAAIRAKGYRYLEDLRRRNSWWRRLLRILLSMSLHFAGIYVLALLLLLTEGQENMYKFGCPEPWAFAEEVSSWYCSLTMSVYLSMSIVHAYGLGDVVLVRPASRWLVMAMWPLFAFNTLFFMGRCSEALRLPLDRFATRYLVGQWKATPLAVEVFYYSFYVSIMVAALGFWAVYVTTSMGPLVSTGEPLGWTDAVWYGWAALTTVGYGDVSAVVTGWVDMSRSAAWCQYSLFVVCNVMMDSILNRAYTSFMVESIEGEEGAPLGTARRSTRIEFD